MVLSFLLGLERRNPGNSENPVEDASEQEEIVRRVVHPNGRDSSPCEKRRGSEWDAGEQETLQSNNNGRIFQLKPFELERSPAADEESSLSAEKSREQAERNGIEGGKERRGEEEGDLSSDQRHPYTEEASKFDIERIDDIGYEEADCECSDNRSAAEVEEKRGAWDKSNCDPSIVGER